jgi:hypothetical protein
MSLLIGKVLLRVIFPSDISYRETDILGGNERITEFNTIIENAPGKDTVYTIKFTTDNKEHFDRLQEEARKCVDGLSTENTPREKCYANCVRCEYFQCPGGNCSECKTYLKDECVCRCLRIKLGAMCPYFMEVK